MLLRGLRKLAAGLVRWLRCERSRVRSALLVLVAILFACLMLSAVVARHIAGRCPHCNLPTFYTAGRMSHGCLRCGRVYNLGSEGERTRGDGNRIQRRRSQPSPRRSNRWPFFLKPRAAAFGVNLTIPTFSRP